MRCVNLQGTLITIELSCVIELSFEIRGKDTKIKN